MQHAAALGSDTRTSTGRELHDDVGTDLADPFLEFGELVRVRCRGPIVVADVDVHQRGAGFEGGGGGFDLLADRDGDRRVVLLPRYGPGDGGGDDAGLKPLALHWICIP